MSEQIILKIVDMGGDLRVFIDSNHKVHPLDLLRAMTKAQARVIEKYSQDERKRQGLGSFEEIGGSSYKTHPYRPDPSGSTIEGYTTLGELIAFFERYHAQKEKEDSKKDAPDKSAASKKEGEQAGSSTSTDENPDKESAPQPGKESGSENPLADKN